MFVGLWKKTWRERAFEDGEYVPHRRGEQGWAPYPAQASCVCPFCPALGNGVNLC